MDGRKGRERDEEKRSEKGGENAEFIPEKKKNVIYAREKLRFYDFFRFYTITCIHIGF